MKVSIADFKNALTLFEAKVITSQTTTMNKFALGIALSRLNAGADKMIETYLDDGGMVDLAKLRADIDAGLKASGGELEIVPQFDPQLRLLGLTIKNIKFTKDDFEDFFDNIIPQVSPSAID